MINSRTGLESYSNILLAIGQRTQALRLSRNWTQQEHADRSGIGVATLHRFEKTGHVSVENALRIATALGAESTFERLFETPKYTSLDEALGQNKVTSRKRAIRTGGTGVE
ncbi:helix-turn-helix transcriptional regulator [Bdellovibrionota bacterium FG-1]